MGWNLHSLFRPGLALATGLMLGGCGGDPAGNGAASGPPGLGPDVVAMVGGEAITVAEFEEALAERLRGQPRPGEDRALREEVLEDLVRRAVVHARAKASGFDQRPDVRRAIRDLVVHRFLEEELVLDDSPPTDAEVAAYYAEHRERWRYPEARRGAVILLKVPSRATEEKQAEWRARAEAVLEEARAARTDEDFAQVVMRHSHDHATRYRAGDTGWLERDSEVHREIAAALFELEPGEFGPLLRTSRGYCIVKLIEVREAGYRPLKEVREALSYELSRRKRQEATLAFHARMREGLEVVTNTEALHAVPVPVSADRPPGTPRGSSASARVRALD